MITEDSEKRKKEQEEKMDQSITSNKKPNSADKSAMNTEMQMKAYVNDLKEYTKNISGLVEDLLKTTDPSREDSPENIVIREKTSEKQSKLKCGVPLTIETPKLHDIGHVIHDILRDHLCHELPGNSRKLFDSAEYKEHLLALEEIRCAEKNLMEAEESLLRTGGKRDQIELKPCYVEKFSLLCLRMISNDKRESNSNSNVDKMNVYGIHQKLRRSRLDEEHPKLLNVEHCRPKIMEKYPKMVNSLNTNLVVNPNYVRFKGFVPGKIYKKKVTVTNTEKRMTAFKLLSSDRSHNAFDYDYSPKCPLAPGMNAKLTVTFKCTSMENVNESITIITTDNKKTSILISAEN